MKNFFKEAADYAGYISLLFLLLSLLIYVATMM